MLEKIKHEWTVVAVGRWNIGILSPKWLGQNIFKNEKIILEFATDLKLPPRIISKGIVIIPTESKLIIGIYDDTVATIEDVEKYMTEILRILPHTPISQIGVNFGYRENDIGDEILAQFPNICVDKLSDNGFEIKNRHFIWKLSKDGITLNLSALVEDNNIVVKLNYHFDVEESSQAIECISGKSLQFKEDSENVLKNVFGLILEGT